MKAGLRKLCDVAAGDGAAQSDLEARLSAAGIRFEIYWHVRRVEVRPGVSYLRYAVHTRDLAAARGRLPLALRGFRAHGEALHGGKHA